MKRLQGIAVAPGVAVGEAMVMDNEGFRIPRRFVARDVIEQELSRLDIAIEEAAAEIEQNRLRISQQLGDQYAAIFSAHLQMLLDVHLRSELEGMIRDRHYSPEYAVSRALRRYAKVFEEVGDSYLSQRSHDIVDIEKRLLRKLLGHRREELSQLTSEVLVLAHNLTPSETANLDRRFVKGFVTEVGGPGSHTSIVAEALAIPAIVGTGPFLTDVSGGDVVIIDGNQGLLILNPDEETMARYRHEMADRLTRSAELEELRELPAETSDGERVLLMGNIEFPYEVEICRERGSDGIGLYRTEFLYLGADVEPTEEVHYAAYAAVIKSMSEAGNLPVTIRTIDLGADKLPTVPDPEDERNPCLGLRSIRLSLRNVPLFRTQLRAILRASVLGDVRIMFPMITTLTELRQARMILNDVIEDLEETNVRFRKDVSVGMMVEVPSAVVMLDRFVDDVDFFSVGTNDLIQYTLAVDRGNKDVADIYTAADPAVLRLIQRTFQVARDADREVNLCGQMSGNPRYTMLLLGMGLRSFSVTPSAIPEIKKICRSVTVEQCQAVAEKVFELDSAREIKRYLLDELEKAVPEMVG